MRRPGDELWALTLREIDACVRAYQAEEELLNFRAGLAASAVYNVNRQKASEPVHPLDFFGRKQTAVPSAQQRLAEALQWTAAVKRMKGKA